MNKYRTDKEIENEADEEILYYHKFVKFDDISNEFLKREFKTTKAEIAVQLYRSLSDLTLVIYEETKDSEKYKSDFACDCVYFVNKKQKAKVSSVLDYFKNASVHNENIFDTSDIREIKAELKRVNS